MKLILLHNYLLKQQIALLFISYFSFLFKLISALFNIKLTDALISPNSLKNRTNIKNISKFRKIMKTLYEFREKTNGSFLWPNIIL